MATKETTATNAPAHVPADMVRNFAPNADPNFERDPYGVWSKLKEFPSFFYNAADFGMGQGGEMGGGRWVVTSAEYVREVFQNSDVFGTALIGAGGDGVSAPRRYVPLAIDPPEHNKFRVLIAPLFSPKNIDKLEAQVAQVTNDLLDDVAKKGGSDFMHDFARVFPGTIFMILMGLPLDQRDQFLQWEEDFFHGDTLETKGRTAAAIFQYLQALIAEKRKNPGDDLVSILIDAEVDGESMSQADLEDFCFLLYIAGLDTVNSGLGHIFKYLAQHPEAQKELREDPEKISGFVEEMLRYHAWINTVRVLKKDHEFHGVQMKAGDRIELHDHMASHDPASYDDPDTVDIAREPNPHFAFGGGAHRCAGSHLARRELRVAVREWLQRVPEFSIAPGKEALYFPDGMLALRTLPLSWDASKVR